MSYGLVGRVTGVRNKPLGSERGMRIFGARAALASAAVWLVSLAAASSAAACGGDLSGTPIEHGRTKGGVRWNQRSCLVGHELFVELSMLDPHNNQLGGGMSLPISVLKGSLVVDATGIDLGSDHENEIDGVAWENITRLRIETTAGKPLIVRTRRAPPAERKIHRYLRRLRFFVIFYPGMRGRATRVCGLTNRDQRVGCQRRG